MTPAPATIICPRCRIDVPADKVALPNRCGDRDCPLAAAPASKREGE